MESLRFIYICFLIAMRNEGFLCGTNIYKEYGVREREREIILL